jgi:hypothetical protein
MIFCRCGCESCGCESCSSEDVAVSPGHLIARCGCEPAHLKMELWVLLFWRCGCDSCLFEDWALLMVRCGWDSWSAKDERCGCGCEAKNGHIYVFTILQKSCISAPFLSLSFCNFIPYMCAYSVLLLSSFIYLWKGHQQYLISSHRFSPCTFTLDFPSFPPLWGGGDGDMEKCDLLSDH